MSEPAPSLLPAPDDVEGARKGHAENDTKSKDKKRRLFGLGKKKDRKDSGDSQKDDVREQSEPASGSASRDIPILTKSPPGPTPMTPVSSGPQSPLSANHSPFRVPRSASPRLLSPASSLIFERNVQEPTTVSDDLSSSIPSHVLTEDKIPAVLEASSIAITDDHLDPDDVEVLTHSGHTPAGAAVPANTSPLHGGDVSGALSLISPLPPSQTLSQDIASTSGPSEAEEAASSYGAIDTSDVRRLSFISFADVVQAENVEARDSLLQISPGLRNRSPSPVRSPASVASSQAFGPPGAHSPPTSGGSSFKGLPRAATGSSFGFSSAGQQSPPGTATGGPEVVSEKMSTTLKMLHSSPSGDDLQYVPTASSTAIVASSK